MNWPVFSPTQLFPAVVVQQKFLNLIFSADFRGVKKHSINHKTPYTTRLFPNSDINNTFPNRSSSFMGSSIPPRYWCLNSISNTSSGAMTFHIGDGPRILETNHGGILHFKNTQIHGYNNVCMYIIYVFLVWYTHNPYFSETNDLWLQMIIHGVSAAALNHRVSKVRSPCQEGCWENSCHGDSRRMLTVSW